MGNCHFCGKFVGDSNMGCVLELYPASLEDPAENALVCADHINGIMRECSKKCVILNFVWQSSVAVGERALPYKINVL